jgi:predicted RNA-binding protein with RPS1 domain
MRLSFYIQRTRALGDAAIAATTIDELAELIDGGADLATLLKKRSATLTARLILGIWRAWRRHHDHMASLDRVAERRRVAGQSAIVPALLKQTVAAHEVAVLERAEEMAPPSRVPEHRRRDAIKEALTLWNSCLATTRKEGRLVVGLAEGLDPESEIGGLAGEGTLAERTPEDWRRIRHAVDAGLLTLHLEAPIDRLKGLVSARGAEIQALTTGRTLDEFLRDLILVDVAQWALELKDDETDLIGIREACNIYFELLSAARPAQTVFAGVWVPPAGEPLGVAVLTREGRLLEMGETDDPSPMAAVERILGAHPVEAVILPDHAADDERLAALRAGFTVLPQIEGQAAAIEPALEATPEEGPEHARRALALARRVVRPLKYWCVQDPVTLHLHDQQADLPEEPLRVALNDMRALALAGVKPTDLKGAGATTARPGAPRAPAKPLNPMLKSVDDLRPGLPVNGIVTNITQFGAFVNIGLSHEGLVHVSELADHFVHDPKEVVTVGQQVEARVLGVDRARRRISLSLRADRGPAAAPTARRETDGTPTRVRLDDIPGGGRNERRQGPGGDRPRAPAATGASRAQALAELEALFKKK